MGKDYNLTKKPIHLHPYGWSLLGKGVKKILRVLFEDGRMSIANIAKKTGIRRDSVARRIKRMKDEKIITGILPVVNPTALGVPNIAILLLRVKTSSEIDSKSFLNKLIANRYIVHVSKLIGKFDYYAAIVYENTGHLNEMLENIKK